MTDSTRVAPADRPIVVLVNQLSRHGHLDLYARLYTASMLEIGYKVVLIEQQDSGVKEWLARRGTAEREHFTAFVRDELHQWEAHRRAEEARTAIPPPRGPSDLSPKAQRRVEEAQVALPAVGLPLDLPTEALRRVEEARVVPLAVGLPPDLPTEALRQAEEAQVAVCPRDLTPDPPPPGEIPPLMRRLVTVWKNEGFEGVVKRLRRRLDPVLALWTLASSTIERFGKAAKRLLCPFDLIHARLPSIPLKNAGFGGVTIRLRRRLGPIRARLSSALRSVSTAGRDRYVSGFSFAALVDEIRIASTRIHASPSLVFFLYLDMMNERRDELAYLETSLQSPWAGILFHPRDTGREGSRAEYYFGCANATGAAFLNPHSVSAYQNRFPNHRYCAFPDVTETALPAQPSALANRLRDHAGSRTIVLLLGSIGPHKGVLDFIEVIRRCDPERFFFAMIGEVFWEAFGNDQRMLRTFFATAPENLFFQPGYLEDECELNAVIATVDIVFAVYRDFRDSSNSLTKASLFEKPIVVSGEYLMGERVRTYRTGLPVSPGNIEEIVAALEKLRGMPRSEFGFAAYANDHSLEALKTALATAVPRWIAVGRCPREEGEGQKCDLPRPS